MGDAPQLQAEAITKQLKAGGDFAKAAEKNSKDPSGKSGGDQRSYGRIIGGLRGRSRSCEGTDISRV